MMSKIDDVSLVRRMRKYRHERYLHLQIFIYYCNVGAIIQEFQPYLTGAPIITAAHLSWYILSLKAYLVFKRKYKKDNFLKGIHSVTLRLVSSQENYPWIRTDKKMFLCLVSSGLELMTLTQRKIFLSVPVHG